MKPDTLCQDNDIIKEKSKTRSLVEEQRETSGTQAEIVPVVLPKELSEAMEGQITLSTLRNNHSESCI